MKKNRTGTVSRRHVFPGDLCTYGGKLALVLAVERGKEITALDSIEKNITVWGIGLSWQDAAFKLQRVRRDQLKLEARLA